MGTPVRVVGKGLASGLQSLEYTIRKQIYLTNETVVLMFMSGKVECK